LPPSRVFRGTGLAILNTNLIDSTGNVQLRFKSSQFGRQSHGHDPENSFTLNAYGEQLLVNNVYRDLYGSPFHAKWCWETKAQNAMLVNGEGQKVHSPEPMGRIAHDQLEDGLDWITGDAAAAYGDKLKKYLRHVIFVKPDVVVLVDDVEAAQPSTFQWMLHAQTPFTIDGQQLRLDRDKAGVQVEYIAPEPLAMRQWDGYDPPPGSGKAAALDRRFPNQWHVEAGTKTASARAFTITVLRPYRAGQAPSDAVKWEHARLTIPSAGGAVEISFAKDTADFAMVRKAARTWRLRQEQ
jgi:Heparinase II/III-like protein